MLYKTYQSTVLLVSYSGEPSYYAHYIPDLSLAYISAAAKNMGYGSKSIDLNHLDFTQNNVLDYVVQYKPLFVGMKLIGNGMPELVKLAKKIKKVEPKSIIVAGGPQVTTFRDTIYSYTNIFDFLIYGEGEKATMELISFLEGKLPISKVRNLIYKNANNIITNPMILERNLDSLPYPNWQVHDLNKYFPVFMVNMVIGCQYQCAFCSHNYFWGRETTDKDLTGKTIHEIRTKNIIRKRSWQNIQGEINENIAYFGVSLFEIVDSTPDIELLRKFAKYLNNAEFSVNWVGFGRVAYYDEKFLKDLSLSGCIALWYGIESGNEEILRKMGKSFKIEEVKKTIVSTKENGIKTICAFIVGFPGETSDSLSDTLRLMEELKPDTTILIPFFLQRGSPIAYSPHLYNVKVYDDWISRALKPWSEKEQHQIDYYSVSNTPNSVWWEQFKEQSKYTDWVGKRDLSETEIAELLSHLLGIDRDNFVYRVNDAIKRNDKQELLDLINQAWEISKQRSKFIPHQN